VLNQANNNYVPPDGWEAPVGWQVLFTSQELSFHPDKTCIFQRVTKTNQVIEAAKNFSTEPKEDIIKTTGLGIDWADVQKEAKLAFGKKLLGGS